MKFVLTQKDHTHTHSGTRILALPSTQTSRGQAAADGSVEAGLTDTRVWVKDAAQLDFTEAGDLGVTAPLVLEWKLVTVQHQ